MFESAPDGSSTRGIGLVRDITEQKAAEAALAALMETLEERVRERTEQVRDLASRLTIAEQEERARIAHILHDDLQQVIVAAQMGLASIRQGVPNPQEVSEDVHDILERAVDITRTLSHELSPPLLKGEDLNDLLKWIVERKRTLYGMEVDLDIKGSVHVPDPALCVLLYRLLREPLFNVVKHAGTLRARIIAEETDGHVRIVVVDKGAGFDPALLSEHRSERFGLQSVRERLSLIGGRFEVVSVPGEGTRVTLTVPLRTQTA